MTTPTIITSQAQLDALCATGPGPHHIDTEGRWYRVRGSSRVVLHGSSRAVCWDSSRAECQDSSSAECWGSSSAVKCGEPWQGARLPGVPVIPDLDRRTADAVCAAPDALEMGEWHRCETMHCRAGWYITLAGEAGAALEKQYGPFMAGAAIWDAAHPGEPIPNFFASNDAARADIIACAERAENGGVA